MWYATRASGYTALLLLSLCVVLGILTSSRQSRREWPRFVVQSVHRNVALMAGVFLVVHIVTSVIDPFAKLTFVDAFVPFIATYRPLWLGLGVVAFELLIAITATSVMRHRLGWRSWRFVHLFAYACWPAAVIHGLGTGTDSKSFWALLLVAASVLVVVGALVWRLAQAGPRHPRLRELGILGSVGATVLLAVWIATGPLQHGWAKAAGTPADLLASAGGATSPPAPSPGAVLASGLDDPLNGTLVHSATAVTATLTDARDTALHVVVVASADGTATLTVTRGETRLCRSAATIGSTSVVVARCGPVIAHVQVIDLGNGSISGTLTTQEPAR
jgi:sulfoxide reductase heme-binding subunit YedZ